MKYLTCLVCAAVLITTTAFAGERTSWASVEGSSSVAFGSIKKDHIGEVHHFNTVSGTVSEAGKLAITIDLSSIETNIDIRNERMIEHVFKGATSATFTSQIDMEEISSVDVGTTALVNIKGTLSFVGLESDVEAKMLVARLTEDRVLVTTADFIMLSTADLGLTAGIDKLMELAKLPSITRVTPISVRMVFER